MVATKHNSSLNTTLDDDMVEKAIKRIANIVNRYANKAVGAAIALLMCLFASPMAKAQNLSARTSVQSEVEEGDNFRLEYTINSHDAEIQSQPNLAEGLEIISGPNISKKESYTLINGKASSEKSITFTYIVYATKRGHYTIPGAVINSGGKTIKSNSATINITTPKATSPDDEPAAGSRVKKITESDLVIAVTANKTRVYEQEPIVLTYKVYTRINLDYLNNQAPEFKGFVTQEVDLPDNKAFSTEELNGRTYRTTIWSQYVAFPQQSGTLTIPSVIFDGSVELSVSSDPFEAFFNGGMSYSVPVRRKTRPINIEVLPLPGGKPANFSGGVGHYNMNVEVLTQDIRTNAPLNVKVTISGAGNLKLIKAPEIKWPATFDKYDTQTNDNSELSSRGMTGDITFEYLVVPQSVGNFKVPPIEFAYFDSDSKRYVTLKSQALTFDVKKGSDSSSELAETIKQRNSDIRDIKQGDGNSSREGISLAAAITLYAITIAAFGIILFACKKYIKSRSDVVGRKARKAKDMADKTLAQARKSMAANDAGQFYIELDKAIRGFIAAKFRSNSVSLLSDEEVIGLLTNAGISDSAIKSTHKIIETCQMAKFAGTDIDAAGTLLDEAESVITEINKKVK